METLQGFRPWYRTTLTLPTSFHGQASWSRGQIHEEENVGVQKEIVSFQECHVLLGHISLQHAMAGLVNPIFLLRILLDSYMWPQALCVL